MKQDQFEVRFDKEMRELGHRVTTAKFNQQALEHWDFLVDGKRVEVKGPKAFPKGTPLIDRFLVEWQAVCHGGFDEVKNNIGWVRGQADWIAFMLTPADKEWVWVRRCELESLVTAKVNWASFTWSNARLPDYQAYRRDTRNDLMCLIPKADMLSLPSTKISLDMPPNL